MLMITNENVIAKLVKFGKRPNPQDYLPFRYELMGLIQDGKIRIDTPNLIHCVLEVDCQIRSYQPSSDVTLGVTLSESSVTRIPTGQIQLDETQAAEAIINIRNWYSFMLESHSGPLDFAYGGYDEVERIAKVEIGLFAQELSLVDWLSNRKFLESCDQKYAKGIRFNPNQELADKYVLKFSYDATELFQSCITVNVGSTSHLSKLLDSEYVFDVISHFRHDFSGMLGSDHAIAFFELRKLIDQNYDLPSMDKHSSEAFAIRQLDWMISRYRPELTKELEARPQLPIWTDEDTRRNYSS
ncbi:MAG: hypothetical protein KF836_02425 [Fimbriimonadaceae bacterium]|nr:hypothetical protein [Fimbriimonadaceae bacterium]